MPWNGAVLEETLVPSAARTTAGSIVSGENWAAINTVRAQLNVTAISGVSASLTAFVETTVDGTNWDAVGTFTAATAVTRQVITIEKLVGRQLRVRWAIAGTTPSATFSVSLVGEK